MRFVSKGSDTIRLTIKAGDQLLISNAIELTIEQIGKHPLLTDAHGVISNNSAGSDDLLAHLPTYADGQTSHTIDPSLKNEGQPRTCPSNPLQLLGLKAAANGF